MSEPALQPRTTRYLEDLAYRLECEREVWEQGRGRFLGRAARQRHASLLALGARHRLFLHDESLRLFPELVLLPPPRTCGRFLNAPDT